jgi:hypothetical protein
MAEILGFGITHQPPLTANTVKPGSLIKSLQDPGVPEKYRTPEGWPEAMRKEWSDDRGESHARAHREALFAAIARVRKDLDAFNPDVVIVFGDDQYENFKEDIVPPFCVLGFDELVFQPFKHFPENFWGEPADKEYRVPGHKQAAKYLTIDLLRQHFDMPYAYKPLHEPLGHAFRNTIMYLDWEQKNYAHPTIPIAVNCYGRTLTGAKGYISPLGAAEDPDFLDPPSPTPLRCYELGAAIARTMAASPWRVALIASSSWSHAFLTEKTWHLWPDHDADRSLYDALKKGDYAFWRSRTLEEVEDSGQHEMLNWYCLIGAMAELGRLPDSAEYFESSIMNSNKVIATFKP